MCLLLWGGNVQITHNFKYYKLCTNFIQPIRNCKVHLQFFYKAFFQIYRKEVVKFGCLNHYNRKMTFSIRWNAWVLQLPKWL